MRHRTKALLTLAVVAMGAVVLTATLANAAAVSFSASAPTVDGGDESFTGGGNNGGGQYKGQEFTTGAFAGGYTLTDFTFQMQTGGTTVNIDWDIRVLEVTPGANPKSTTTLYSEAGFIGGPFNSNDYVTFTPAIAVSLNANTLYAVEAELINHTGDGSSNFLYGSGYAGGEFYDNANPGLNQISTNGGRDWNFHVNLLEAIPEPSTLILAVLGLLGVLGFRRRRRRR
jgi:hypothetical protein